VAIGSRELVINQGSVSQSATANMPGFGGRRGGRYGNCQMNTGQVEITGDAYLYFVDNYSYFQGIVNTDGESNYSITGELTDESDRTHARHSQWNPKSKLQNGTFPLSTSSTGSSTPYDSDEDADLDFVNRLENEGQLGMNISEAGSRNAINLLSTQPDPEERRPRHSHKMTLTDHYTGLIYNFPSIVVNRDARNDDTLLLSYDPNAQIHFKTKTVYKGQKAAMVIQRSLGSSSLLGKQCIVYSGKLLLRFSDEFQVSEKRDWSL